MKRNRHSQHNRTRRRRKQLRRLLLISILASTPGVAHAQLPTGADVIGGQAAIAQAGNALNVDASTTRAIVNWDSFSVGAGNVANFNLPDTGSAILNRVTSANMPSTIAGAVNSNGHVYLVNPSGIVVSSSGMVNTNGFTASTFDVTNQDFMNGGALTFADNGSTASIVNDGTIATGAGGAHLIASDIANNGTIQSNGGNITLSSGGSVTLDNGVTYVQPSMATLESGISPTAGLIQNTGTIRATGAATSGGEVYLVNPNGEILHDGTIAASQTSHVVTDDSNDRLEAYPTVGGRVQLEADEITIAADSTIDATGTHGGGEVLVGGDWQGSGTMTQATTVTMDAGATINASATETGDGGTIVLWSDVTNADSITKAFGSLVARAGELLGDGGRIETSGAKVATDGIAVDAGAKNGSGGNWLIDPYNYLIDAVAASNIVSALNTGTSVTVTTTANNGSYGSSGTNADLGDIVVGSDIVTGAMSGDATLTLQAHRHINVDANIDATQNGNTAKLNVTLLADSDLSGDGINIVNGDSIKTNGGNLTFGDGSTATIGGSSVQVGGDVYISGTAAQSLETGGGTITVNGETILANTNSVTFNSGGGNILFGGVLNSGNQYTYVDGPDGQTNSWDWARSDAKNGTAGGAALGDSYMVTITSRLENAIAGIAAGYRGAWIGAHRPSGLNWQWADGPEAGQTFLVANNGVGGGTTQPGYYSNFGTGEPNGQISSGENKGQFFGDQGLWNDLGSSTTFSATQTGQYDVLGYVRETNLAPTAVTIDAGTGSVTINGGVGNGKALASLNVTSSATTVNGDSLITTGAQNYSSALDVTSTLGLAVDGTTLTTGGALDFSATGDVDIDASIVVPGAVSIVGNDITLVDDIDTSSAVGADILLKANDTLNVDASGVELDAGSGDITVRANTFAWGTKDPTLKTTGDVAILPSTDSSSFTHTAVKTSWFIFDPSLGSLQIGHDANTSGITVDTAQNIAGPISLYGGNIAIDAGLNTSGGGSAADVLLKATGNVVLAENLGIVTDGGDITLWSDSDSSGQGYIFLKEDVSLDSRTAADRTATTHTTGGGNITLGGGADDGNGAPSGYAVAVSGDTDRGGVNFGDDTVGGHTNNTQIFSGGGDVDIRGKSSHHKMGFNWVDGGTIDAGSTGLITIEGVNTSTGHGIEIGAYNNGETSIIQSGAGAGAINLTGTTSSTTNTGFQTTNLVARATGSDGSISVNGSSGTGTGRGVLGYMDLLAADGPISVDGGAAGISLTNSTIGRKAATPVTTSSADVTLAGDSVALAGTNNIATSGTVTVEPSGTSFDSSLAWPLSNLTLSSDISGLTIGKTGNTADISINSAQDIAGPINVYGGLITLGDDLTSSATTGTGILLHGTGILQSAGVDVKTSGADIEYVVSGAEFTAGDDRSIYLQGTSGSLAGIDAAGGDISISSEFGTTGTVGGSDRAIMTTFAEVKTSGTGTITIVGDGTNNSSTGNVWGMQANDTVLQTESGALDMTLTGGKASGNSRGLAVDGQPFKALSESGDITIRDLQPTGLTGNYNGLYLRPSATADIVIGADGSTVASSSSNISIEADKLNFAANGAFATAVNTSGDLVIESTADSFAAGVTLSNLAISGDPSSLRFGKTTNTADLTFAVTANVAGDIDLNGGNIAIDGAITSTGSNAVNIVSSGTVTDGALGYIVADQLAITGSSSTTLDNVLNDVNTMAFDGASLNYVNQDALTIGTVGSTSGIDATGKVAVGTLTGDLTIASNIASDDTSATAVAITAGTNAAAGTILGGNIIVSGSPTISVGTGGRATLFTGGIADSTGFTDLIGSGSGNFRYNSDESATNYTAALGSGVYGIYREQPTAGVVVDDKTAVYGDTLSLTTSLNGGVNGDTHSQVFGSAPTITVGGATSTSGNATVGDHTLTVATAAEQLGYDISGYTDGTLTVNAKSITTPIAVNNKVYDGTTATTITAGANGTVAGDAVVVNGTAVFDNSNAGTGKTVSITGLNVTGADASNYVLSSTTDTGTADITKKQVTVSGLAAENRVYDGTTVATLDHSGVVFTGIVSGDNLTAASTGGTFDNKNVGTGKTVTLSGTVYGGTDASNYSFVDQATSTANITSKTVNVSGITADNKVYDGTTTATFDHSTASLNGVVAGDDVTASGTTGTFADKHAEANKTVTLGGTVYGGADKDNYTFADQASATADISKLSVTVSGINANNKTYDATATAVVDLSGVTFNGKVAGDDLTAAAATGVFSDKNAANGKQVSLSGTTYGGADLNNYDITDQSATIADITPKAVTIAGITANDKVYDSTTAATLAGTATINTISGDDVSIETSAIANFADKNAGASKSVTVTGFALSGTDADNYSLSQPTGLNADITPAPLTITANNDGKFVTKADAIGYAGANFDGFVGSEGTADLGGSLGIARIGTDELAGTYSGALAASGLTSTNYDINFVNGDYTIIPAEQFLIRFGNSNSTYGDSLGYSFLTAEYMDAGFSIASLTPTINGNQYSFNDGVGGTAQFTIGMDGTTLSTSGHANVGSYTLAMNDLIASGGNFSNNLNLFGTHTIDRANLIVGAGGVSKTYDGTNEMNNLTLNLSGLVAGDTVNINGQGSYADRHSGTGLSYTVANLALSGTDANNYTLPAGTVLSDTNGIISAKNVTINAPSVTKVYDGNTAFDATASQLQDWTTALGINGDTVDGITLTYDDKNVGTGKALTPSSILISDGNGGANYNITFADSIDNTITRLSSVTWIGGPTGDWNNPANWAGGAVPDLANVANVIIPSGVTPTFDATVAGPVHLDSFAGGSLQLDGGTLDVFGLFGADTLTQNGGTLNAGDLTATDLVQNGGAINVNNDFTVTNTFTQSTTGTIDVGGNADITHVGGTLSVNNLSAGNVDLNSTNGGVHLNNLQSDGSLVITATDDVTQDNTGSVTVDGETTVTTDGDIILDGSNNDFVGPVNLDGDNVTIADSTGGLTLGDVTTIGSLDVTTVVGDITQSPSSEITIGGTTSLTADGDIDLSGNNNHFTGPVDLDANNAKITQSIGDLILDTVNIVDKFVVNVTNGGLSQTHTGSITIGGKTDFTTRGPVDLSGNNNRFQDTVTVNAPTFDIQSTAPLTIIRTGAALAEEVSVQTNAQLTNDTLVRPRTTARSGWFKRTMQVITNLVSGPRPDSPQSSLTEVDVQQTNGETFIRPDSNPLD